MKQPWKTDEYFVCPSNYAEGAVKNFNLQKDVKIHDVTLRDGEQQPGVAFTKDDKVRIAKMLSEAGVHRIEAGMPAVSESDREAFREIVGLGLDSEIFAFCRAIESDIELAADLGVDGVIVEIPSNEELIKYGYKWPLSRPFDAAVKACNLAHEKGLYVNLFLMDSSRLTAEEFVSQVKALQEKCWIDSCSIVDTQGTLSMNGARYMMKTVIDSLDIPVEAHFHNDLGLGTANALAAFESGASVLHTTVLGLGPRAGQGTTEQVAMGMKLLYDYDSGIQLNKLYNLGVETAKLARVDIPGNQPVLGDKVYLIEAGMPATWWQNIEDDYPLSLYGILPSVMGQPPITIVLGKGSGKASIEYWLNKLKLELKNEGDVDKVLLEVKDKGLELKRNLTSVEFIEIVSRYQ